MSPSTSSEPPATPVRPGRTPLTDDEVEAAVGELSGWAYDGGRLVKTFRFPDFRAAVAFVVRLAFEAEALDHHPELTNVYNRVTLALCTHDAGDRVTAMDVALARRVDEASLSSDL